MSLLQTSLISTSWTDSIIHINKVANSEIDLTSIEQSLQFLIQQYQGGQRKTSDLVSKELAQLKLHTTEESNKTRKVILHLVTDELEQSRKDTKVKINSAAQSSTKIVIDKMRAATWQADDEARKANLLKSLKFPGLNERYNQIPLAHENTCGWIFNDPDAEKQRNPNKSVFVNAHGHESPKVVWDSFPAWLQSNDPSFRISGKPGSGKSTVVTSILSAISPSKLKPNAVVLSHFLWRPGLPCSKTSKDCYALFYTNSSLRSQQQSRPCLRSVIEQL